MAWITTKDGRHVNTDWFSEDQRQKYSQIEANQAEANRLNGKQITSEDIQRKLIGSNSYTNSPEYKALREKANTLNKTMRKESDRRREIEKELEHESSPKPRSEYTTEDEINVLLGKHPTNYTQTGLQLKQEQDRIFEDYHKNEEEWSSVTEKLNSMDRAESSLQRSFYSQRAHPDVTKASREDYVGFKKNETTTPYIDDMIKSGRADIVEMSPKTYLQEVAYNIFDQSTLETTLRGTSVANINRYMAQMRSGTKFDTPYLNYRDNQQEGRHRAIAAAMLGIDKIPVVIVRR